MNGTFREFASRFHDEGVCENRHDFFHMVRDQNKAGRILFAAKTIQKTEKMFARRRIQSRARFIENE